MDSLDDKTAARVDAFIERLRMYGNRMQGKFVKKLSDDIFELRIKQFDRIFRVLFFYQLSAGNGTCDYLWISEKEPSHSSGRNR